MSDSVPVVTDVYKIGHWITVNGRSGQIVGRRHDAAGITLSILVNFSEGRMNCAGFIPRIESLPIQTVRNAHEHQQTIC